ncbi:cocosin 1-like isoform X1 [Silene latifolia]|uniref:cocosin 1-like isoform X1 n=1 Tax=Silene latifolia TaxID=37657 RepID=UPI003D775DEA
MEEMSLSPSQESPIMLIEGNGGSYYVWNTTIFPFLGAAKVAAAVLVLNPGGFALPHYADCNKIGYVIQGTEGIAGLIDSATSKEKVVKLKKGDAIAVPVGGVSWWSNAGDDEVKIVFLGESVNDLGQFTYCILTGPMGILKAFPTTTICKAFDMNQEQANELVDSQKEPLIIKLDDPKTMHSLSKRADTKALCYNFDEKPTHINVKNGGSYTSLTKEKYPLLEGIELSGNFLRLEPNAMFGPVYYARDSGVQITYVVKGGGWVQVVSLTGKIVLDIPLKAGQVFGVPKLYLVSIGAGDEGIECFSIIKTSKPILGEVAGEKSVWKSLSPAVLQASLNISPEFYKTLVEKLDKSRIIRPAH